MKIAVGLSGGVDSAVTAALLQAAGHEVIGITMKIWQAGRYKGGPKDACFGPGEAEDISRAEAICRQLGIPYHVFDCSRQYEDVVLKYFRDEYLNGHTPNPCVRCNAFMKFGVLPNLARNSGLLFEKFATGHYARIEKKDGLYHLFKGNDASKDQSYFLYRLNQAQLSGLLFPLGALSKREVREIAAQFDLAVQDKPDSQDFYSGDHTELLHAPDRVGSILNTSGQILGKHNGFWHYTIGQRKGLGVSAPKPLYVVEINPCRNEVIVGSSEDMVTYHLKLDHLHWLHRPYEGELEVKIRSSAATFPAFLTKNELTIPQGISAPARGQSAVFYRNEEVLGGGIIMDTQEKIIPQSSDRVGQ